jgi:hypothetical protein
MKNIHILPTENPSILYAKDDNYKLANSTMAMDWYISSAGYKPYNIYITSDEEITGFEHNIWVIKGERIFLWQNTMALVFDNKPRKIILTTDQDLIKDGVQAIDDEFLEWFVKKPSCERVEVDYRYDINLQPILDSFGNKVLRIKIPTESENLSQIIIPKVESKQETLEEVKDLAYYKTNAEEDYLQVPISVLRYISQLEQEQEQDKNKYSEEDMKLAFETGRNFQLTGENNFNELIEQFKKK